jgi:hypothetical protein
MNPLKREPDSVESEIIQAINAMCARDDASDWNDTQWTRHAKNAVAQLGKSKKYWIYASGCDFVDSGEWLYDLCWLDYSGKNLVAAPLVMEIEWYSRDTDVDDDFQKLLLARCDHRVMLFRPRKRSQTRAAVEVLLPHISSCRHGCAGDKYLFGCWNDTFQRFDWFAYELPMF